MTHTTGINEKLIRLLVNPLFKNKPIPFKNSLAKARRMLIFLPPADGKQDADLLIGEIGRVFGDREILLICHMPDTRNYEEYRVNAADAAQTNFFSIRKSPLISQLAGAGIDIFIDLYPADALINLYICRLLKPEIRAALSKPNTERYYNLEYTPSPLKSPLENALGMIRFLDHLK